MRIIFRVDASSKIGTGHVMRCLSLAHELQNRGCSCSFICREHHGNLISKIQKNKYEVFLLPFAEWEPKEKQLNHAKWLGCSWEEDANQSKEILKEIYPDWLIVDHYAIDKKWEERVAGSSKKLMVIDDIADREHVCDILLDQNLIEGMDSRYIDLVPAKCKFLLGPNYALLGSEYSEFHTKAQPKSGSVKQVLVYFGGADVSNLTSKTISALAQINNPSISIQVVLANNSHQLDYVKTVVSEHKNISLHDHIPSLAQTLSMTDIAVGGGGTTNWERICLGVPSLVVTMGINQEPIAKKLSENKLICLLGSEAEINTEQIRDSLEEVFATRIDKELSQRCLSLVDGLGTKRVCKLLLDTLVARRATVKDESVLLEWVNDPITRKNSFATREITEQEHKEWFSQCLNNHAQCRLYIVENSIGENYGTVRFNKQQHFWDVHFSLAPSLRGLGFGKTLLQCGMATLQKEFGTVTIVGHVKQNNIPSVRIFESLGFFKKPSADKKRVVFTLEKPPTNAHC